MPSSRTFRAPSRNYQWRTLAGPAMLPVLRRLIAAAPTDAPSAADLALRRLTQLAPDEARPLMLREIHAALLQRYATRNVAPRVLASAGEKIGAMACNQQDSILAYFLRVDEATGSTLLDRAMTSRATGCWRSLNEIAALRMTPVVQARAIADLENPDPDVVIAAIHTLGQHGSPAALEPLRMAFQRWLKSLCVTDSCRTQTGRMIHEDDTRIMLWSINEPDESHIELA